MGPGSLLIVGIEVLSSISRGLPDRSVRTGGGMPFSLVLWTSKFAEGSSMVWSVTGCTFE